MVPLFVEEVPRLSDHFYQERRRKIHIIKRLINCLEGEKELHIFCNFDIAHFIEEYVIVILKELNPRLRKVWPEIIDDKEEALGAGVIHWV